MHVVHLSPLHPLSLYLCTPQAENSHTNINSAATHCCPGTTLPHGLDSLASLSLLSVSQTQGFHVSVTFSADVLKTYCVLSPTHFPLPTKHPFLHFSGHPCPTLPVSHLCFSLSLLISLLFLLSLSLSLFLSPFLSVCISLSSFLFCFSHSLSFSTPRPTPNISLSPGLVSPWGKVSVPPATWVYPTESRLARVCRPSLALSLFIMLPSQSLFLIVSAVLSPRRLLSLTTWTCSSQSLSLSLPLPCLPSQRLLAPVIIFPGNSAHLYPSSLLPSPLPSLHGGPAHLPKPLLAGCVPNL